MDEKMRERIALKRFELISPVLAEPGRVQNEYMRKQAELKHEFPGSGSRAVAVSTLKSWLRMYRKKGLEGLKPKKRSDGGRPRRMTEEMMKTIEVKCKAYPYWTVQKLYEDLAAQGLLGQPPVHYNTLLRVVKLQGWLPPRGRTDVRKRYEVEHANDLWVADFMHGPPVRTGNGRTGKAILCAVIDDHSRLIVGHGFHTAETVSSLTVVLKEALLTYGIPRRLYVDNGPSFSSELLARSCAVARISLIHSRPYDSPSRGKVERFFRTVRERFLAGLQQTVSLTEINQAFWAWLQEDYHHRPHAGIGEKPIERYQCSLEHAQIRRLSKAELDEAFLVRHTRVVGNDATISFQGALYEVPAAYIRQKIELRHPVDEPGELYLYDSGVRVGRVRLLDKKENARTFRPKSLPTQLSFADRRTLS